MAGRRVSWNDCDPSGLIRFQAVVDLFVDAQAELLRAAGADGAFERMPRVAAEVTYRRGVRYDDVVEIELTVEHVGRSSVRYGFVVTKDADVAISGAVTTVFVREGAAAPLPDAVREALCALLAPGS